MTRVDFNCRNKTSSPSTTSFHDQDAPVARRRSPVGRRTPVERQWRGRGGLAPSTRGGARRSEVRLNRRLLSRWLSGSSHSTRIQRPRRRRGRSEPVPLVETFAVGTVTAFFLFSAHLASVWRCICAQNQGLHSRAKKRCAGVRRGQSTVHEPMCEVPLHATRGDVDQLVPERCRVPRPRPDRLRLRRQRESA